MKYACLVYVEGAVMDALTTQQGQQLTDDSMDYDSTIRARGQLIMAQALQSPETAVTIRVRNGKISSTDGPFAETKEQLAGFLLVEARDLNEAIAMAAAAPMAGVGAIEVRPFLDLSHS